MSFEAAKAARSARASDSSCFHCFESIKTDAHAQSPKDTWSRNDFFLESVFENFDYNVRDKFVDNFVNKISVVIAESNFGKNWITRTISKDDYLLNFGDNLVQNLVVNATLLTIFKTFLFEKFEDNFEKGIWSLLITNFLNQDIIPVNHPFSVLFLHPSAVTRSRLHSQPWAKLLQVLLTALSSWAAAVQHYKWMDATERQINI